MLRSIEDHRSRSKAHHDSGKCWQRGGDRVWATVRCAHLRSTTSR